MTVSVMTTSVMPGPMCSAPDQGIPCQPSISSGRISPRSVRLPRPSIVLTDKVITDKLLEAVAAAACKVLTDKVITDKRLEAVAAAAFSNLRRTGPVWPRW